jgi:flavodoxin
MKKAITVLFAILPAVYAAACGNTSANQRTASSMSAGTVLIAYFTHEGNTVFDGNLSDIDAVTSASVQRRGNSFPPQVIDGKHKGNTQIIAEYIAEHTGGTLFAIQIADKYPVDGYETLDVSQDELAANTRPELVTHVENIDVYETMYLGYPIWHGTMPMAVRSFLEEYDFSGKTIIPFCTHDGSGLGGSRRDITAACPGATVLDGLAVRYNKVRNTRRDVEAWIDGLKK